MNLTNFGEQFANKVLRRMYAGSVIDGIANRNYEGEIKKPGDRVNILSFLNEAQFSDYAVGTDMTVSQVVDAEDVMVVEKRKYYNFSLDRLEDLFTYAEDVPDALVEIHAQKLAADVDAYGLNKFAEGGAKAGSWIGTNLLILGGSCTQASLVTSATGGTITTLVMGGVTTDETNGTTVENPLDGTNYFSGFQTTDLYKGIRLLSTRAFVTPWYRISAINSTTQVAVTEWDEETTGPDFEENYTLRGTWGGDGRIFPKYNTASGGGSFVGQTATQDGFGWEIQAAIATSVTAATIYDQITLLAERLDDNETPPSDRKFTVPPWVMTCIRQATETQPTGIADLYKATVLNGKIGRLGAFDLHVAQGARVSTRAGRSTSAGVLASAVLTSGNVGYILPANHISALTYADKWSESRVVDAENQFAKKYQGLFLFTAMVPRLRRKNAAVLFGSN